MATLILTAAGGALGGPLGAGVGQVLAATPLSRLGYLLGKFCSNLAVLASMAGVLAVTALVLQLVRGESMSVDPVAIGLPFVLLTLPVLVLTAAAAVLFETLPVLRGGVGNIAWLFLWMISALAGEGAPEHQGRVWINHRIERRQGVGHQDHGQNRIQRRAPDRPLSAGKTGTQ